ncbi:MAG: M28 family metallopeptidase [Eubacterium sp.]
MNEKNRKYGEEAYEIVEYAAKKVGSRLPGSDGEREYAEYMGEKMKEIGVEPKTEEFFVSPRAGIGGLSYAGWFGVVISALTYFALQITSLWVGMGIASIIAICWLVFSCFFYKTWFDMFFHREISRNVYGVLEPEDGKVDYNIILSGHLDTSWCWRHSENAYKYKDKPIMGIITTYSKVGFGAVCFVFMCLVSIFMAVVYTGQMCDAAWAAKVIESSFFSNFQVALHFIPVLTAIGCAFVVMWGDPSEKNASRGAMDNATGCALSFEVLKYFKENPDKLPKGCRIVALNVGSEEAGLRGSMAFAQEHMGDDLTKNSWNINIDSVADKDYFEVVIKDDWQGCRFDTDMEKMFKDTFKELNIPSLSKDHCIHNPVGGCDSTPMTKAGIKSVTFAAQNPMLTYYYHTWRDMPERFEAETVCKGFDVCLGVIDKIAAFQEKNGFNGPQKK